MIAQNGEIQPMEAPAEFIDCLARQRAAYFKDPVPSAESRRADLEALHRMLAENETEIISAIDADFGVRSAIETRLLELFPVREGHPKRDFSRGKVDAPTEADGRLACLSRCKQSRDSSASGGCRSHRALEFSHPALVWAAHRHPGRRQPRHGQDVGELGASLTAAG